jgi:hypothetical protein
VAANGAFHLELGDGDRMLTNEFFPVHRPMHDSLRRAMRDHYSFLVRYENFLFFNNQGGLRDGTQHMRISSDTHLLSKDGSAGKIWTVARIWDGEYDSVSLINLNGTDEQWRNVSENPQFQSKIRLKYHMDRKCRRVFVATPDDGLGRPVELPFTEGNDDGGYFVELTVPSLQWWDLLIFDKTARIKTDGWPGDWRGRAPDQIHGMTVNSGEFIYRGDGGDTRSFTGVTADNDITELRVTADENYLHFLIRMQDIADESIPAIGMAIDTDQKSNDTGHIWLGDASTPDGSILLANPIQYAERQVMIYSEGGQPRIKLWNGGEWYDPPSGVAAVSVSSENECIEASIAKADFGIVSPRQVKLTLASFRSSGSAAGSDATFDSDHDNNDAIDVMGGTPGVRMDSWERDLSDNAINHHATFLVDSEEVRPILIFTGHGRHTPPVPAALSTLMVEVETFPRDAAASATAVWRVNGGFWQELPMDDAGESTERGINDLWRRDVGIFQPGDVVEYHFRGEMPDGASMLDDNGGVNYRADVPVDGDGDGLLDPWELLHGISISSATGVNGAMGDPDRDGVVNLLELAFGGNPNAADSAVLPRAGMTGGRFRIVFNRDLTAGLTLTVEAAGTPAGPWRPLARGVRGEPLESLDEDAGAAESGGWPQREVEISVSTGERRTFLRVKVES